MHSTSSSESGRVGEADTVELSRHSAAAAGQELKRLEDTAHAAAPQSAQRATGLRLAKAPGNCTSPMHCIVHALLTSE